MKTKPIKWVDKPYSYEGMVSGVTMFSFNWRSRSQKDQPTDKPWELHTTLPGVGGRYYCRDQDHCKAFAQKILERFISIVLEDNQ